MATPRRTTHGTKAAAKRVRGAGRRVYKAAGGYRVSPECPRSRARTRALKRTRTKTRGPNRKRPGFKGVLKWVFSDPPF